MANGSNKIISWKCYNKNTIFELNVKPILMRMGG